MSDFTDTTEGTVSWNDTQGSTCLLMPRGPVCGTLCDICMVLLRSYSVQDLSGFLSSFKIVYLEDLSLYLFLALSPIVVEAPVVLGSPCSIRIPPLC